MSAEVEQTTTVEVPPDFNVDKDVLEIYLYVMFTAMCQTLTIFGIATNIINIICFVKQGFRDTINISLIGLSISDLGSLITMVWACATITPAVANAKHLPFDYLDIIFIVSGMPHFAFTRVSSCITAMITVEKCLSIALPLKVKSILTPRRTTVAIVCIFVVFTFSITPIYVVNRLGVKFSPVRNMNIVGLISSERRDAVEKITLSVNNFFIPLGAFVIVASCTIVLSVQLHSSTKWRSASSTTMKTDKVSSRNQRVAKMVATISTMFIVCFLPSAIMMFAVALVPDLSVGGKLVNITIMLSGVSHLLEGINSSMNIFIYYNMSSKFRETFDIVFGRRKKLIQ